MSFVGSGLYSIFRLSSLTHELLLYGGDSYSHPSLSYWGNILLTWCSAPPWGLVTWLNHLLWIRLNLAFVLGIDSSSFWRNDKLFQQLVLEPWVTGSSLPWVGAEGSVGVEGEVVDLVVNIYLGTRDIAWPSLVDQVKSGVCIEHW